MSDPKAFAVYQSIFDNPDMTLRVLSIDAVGTHARRVYPRLDELLKECGL